MTAVVRRKSRRFIPFLTDISLTLVLAICLLGRLLRLPFVSPFRPVYYQPMTSGEQHRGMVDLFILLSELGEFAKRDSKFPYVNQIPR